MRVAIHPIRSAVANCYTVRGVKTIVIDAPPGQVNRFMAAADALSIRPEEISLVVITHGHRDHIGSAKELEELTGARLALHRREKTWLERGSSPLPPGVTAWGALLVKPAAISTVFAPFPATGVDIVLGDGEQPLVEYGIPGKILNTPGHSMGSVSVLLKTGDSFVGDLAMSGFPLRLSPGLSILAEDMSKVRESWRLLLDAGRGRIYSRHGKPFSAEVIAMAL